MADIVLVSGAGRYTDPWHPFEQTSAAIESILTAAGHRVQLRPTESPAALNPAGAELMVVNTGVGADPDHPAAAEQAWLDGFSTLGEWIDAGGPVLAIHTAANTFRDWPRWVSIVGGQWTRGVSSHPERSMAVFDPAPGSEEHPINAGLGQVIAYDERYSFLQLEPGAVPLRQHETGEVIHCCGWVNGRVVYDSLGHDPRSYDSPSRRQLLIHEVNFLLAG